MENSQTIELAPAADPVRISVHTDGACLGNPGPGGAAAFLEAFDAHSNLLFTKEVGKSFPEQTTNQRMELQAAIIGLRAISQLRHLPVTVFSDSQYLVEGMNGRAMKWKANGWRLSDKKPAKNVDLWEELLELAADLNITWTHVKGHAGIPGNEAAHKLAGKCAEKAAAQYKAEGGRP